MATHINLFNHEWCELVFVNRNHSYGAFEIRETNAKRHLIAIVVTLSALMITIFVFGKKADILIEKPVIIDKGNVIISKFNEGDHVVKPPENLIKDLSLLRTSIMFVVPEITRDVLVTDIDTMILSMDEINNREGVISNVNVIGTETGYIVPEVAILEQPQKEKVYEFVSQMPRFPGGEEALFKFLKKNLEYPRVPLENNVQGTVYVRFVVFESGEIGNVEIARGFDADCEKEALRVIKRMEKWLPGKQNGNAVNVRMSIPVKFKITDIR